MREVDGTPLTLILMAAVIQYYLGSVAALMTGYTIHITVIRITLRLYESHGGYTKHTHVKRGRQPIGIGSGASVLAYQCRRW